MDTSKTREANLSGLYGDSPGCIYRSLIAMVLPPFQAGSDNYTTSTVMDANTVGETTVTVAVHAPRQREISVLNSIYESGTELEFKPFYHKAHDFVYTERQQFTEALVEEFHSYLSAFAHHQHRDSNEDTQQVEAIHSAIHVHDRLMASDEPPIVIVDGNEQQARPFVRALSGLRDELPDVAHCQQSESYSPTALLADLASTYLAHRIDDGDPSAAVDNLVLDAPRAKSHRGAEWGQSVSALYQDRIEYEPASLPLRRGDSVRERVNCWYQGAVAQDSGVDRPLSDSLRPVINALERNSYEGLAEILREL